MEGHDYYVNYVLNENQSPEKSGFEGWKNQCFFR
jgi:hypothetical protein